MYMLQYEDDDIFMITESEYEECISNFDENCNLIILGCYECKIQLYEQLCI